MVEWDVLISVQVDFMYVQEKTSELLFGRTRELPGRVVRRLPFRGPNTSSR